MPVEPDRSAPAPPEALAALLDVPFDPARLVCLPAFDEAACSAALVALANGSGGHLLIGALREARSATIRLCASALPADLSERLAALAASTDPPLTGMVQSRSALVDGAELAVLAVRRSVQTPHIDPISGSVFVVGAAGAVEPVRRRADLDRLYRRGAAAETHAQRALDGMAEQLQLASFGHYGMAVIAALLQPSAAPYETWRGQPALLGDQADPFVREWGLSTAEPAVRPSWIELRLERELTGVLRITRAGCAAAAETRSLPSDKVIGSLEALEGRLRLLVDAACRLLNPAENAQILPRLLCEGLRGSRLRADDAPLSAAAVEDTIDLPGVAGDATDDAYRRALATGFAAQLAGLYQLEAAPVTGAG
jgi:hypothetical protein